MKLIFFFCNIIIIVISATAPTIATATMLPTLTSARIPIPDISTPRSNDTLSLIPSTPQVIETLSTSYKCEPYHKPTPTT